MKITEYSELAETPNDNDFLVMVDVSDTTMSANGTTKKVKKLNMGGGGLANIVEDITPQLGGDLDVNGNDIVSVANGNINITTNGTGQINLVSDGVNVEDVLSLADTYGLSFVGATAGDTVAIRTNDANFSGGELLLHSTNTGVDSQTVLNFAKGFTIYSNTEVDGSGATYAPWIEGGASEALNITAGAGGLTLATLANADITLTPHGTGDVIVSSLTASELVATSATKELESLPVATYPSLAEVAHVKGVTSAIQTQLNNKQASGATLTSLEGLTLGAGDTLYATGADTLTDLPIGTAGQVLTVNAGATAPEWASPSSGGSSVYVKYDLYAGIPDATNTATSMQVVYGNTGTGAANSYGDRGWTMNCGSTATGVAWGYFSLGTTASEFRNIFDYNPRCFFTTSFFADNTPANKIWFGIGATHSSSPTDAGTTNKVVGFRLLRSGGTSTLYAVVGNGTSETATDITSSVTDLAVGTGQKSYVFWFDMTSGTNVKFYWGTTLLTTISTNLPSGEATNGAQSIGAFIYNNSTASPSSNVLYFRNAYMELKVV